MFSLFWSSFLTIESYCVFVPENLDAHATQCEAENVAETLGNGGPMLDKIAKKSKKLDFGGFCVDRVCAQKNNF